VLKWSLDISAKNAVVEGNAPIRRHRKQKKAREEKEEKDMENY
jgi:hypothetical protein